MRLLELAVRDFRGIAERQVRFAREGVTIVEGPNEVGKSSLAAAFDLLLDRRDDSVAAEVREAQPVGRDVGPEVAAELEVGRYRVRYRKRFLKQRETVLEVLAPEPESWTGREAHERMEAILAGEADLALWRALRLEQGSALEQPAGLAGAPTLLDALGGQAAAEAAPPQALFDRVLAEHRRYFTPRRGEPTGELREARERLAAAEDEAAVLEREMAGLEADAAESDRLARREVELAGAAERAREEAAAAARELAAVERLEGEAQALRGALVEARGERDLLAELAAAGEAERELDGRLAAARREAAGLAAALAPLEEAACEAAAARDRAEESAAGWRRRAALARRLAERRAAAEALARRHAGAREAAARVEALEERLRALAVDERALDELEARQREVERLEAAVAAVSPRVEVEALADVGYELQGGAAEGGGRLAAGERLERRADGPLRLRFPGVAEVRVLPGGDAGERAARLAATRRELAERLAELAVADLDAARRAVRERREAEGERATARALLSQALAGRRLPDLARDAAAARAEVEGLAAEAAAGADGREPEEEGDAEAALAAAEAAAEDAIRTARARLREAEAARDARRRDADRAVAAVRRLEADHRAAAERLARARERSAALLATVAPAAAGAADARDQLALFAAGGADASRGEQSPGAADPVGPGDALAAALAAAGERVRAAEERHAAARRRLAEARPEAVRAAAGRARGEREAAAGELAAVREARVRVEGRLEMAGERDLFERLEDARARRAAARSAAASVERRARAAARLLEVLAAEREQARSTYSEPLSRCLEELGERVFGAGFAVQLDGELAVARRTAGGVTLPVERLSAGAREQLALLARVACAVLVSRSTNRGGGVPLLVDDALGHSDEERLRAMGEVLSLAGERCQVIILTCFPERYRFVRSPSTVRLAADPAREVEPQGVGP